MYNHFLDEKNNNTLMLMDNNSVWEYCAIHIQMRYKGEDYSRSGSKQMWLVFQARRSGTPRKVIVRESTEIPVPANVIGSILTLKKDNPMHLNIYQDFLHQLMAEGWELLPTKGNTWWERRLRRRIDP